jgi:DNA adenine methylase
MTDAKPGSSSQQEVPPFLKWAGGKRWFVDRYLDIVPSTFGRYIEPFLGSGALFFALQPRCAILSDLNSELIGTFAAVRQDCNPIVSTLRRYHRLHSRTLYYQIRKSRPRSEAVRAARFIYLNRTCWNGLYRVNTRGQFNVPVGTKTNVLRNTHDLTRASALLKRASLMSCDFEVTLARARPGDLIFADPPYVTAHSQNGFLKYNETLFSWHDQVRLMECLRKANERGALILATNADTPSIRKLYEKWFTVRTTTRSGIIAASPTRRGTTNELVITSW